jgi:hypothetical protein
MRKPGITDGHYQMLEDTDSTQDVLISCDAVERSSARFNNQRPQIWHIVPLRGEGLGGQGWWVMNVDNRLGLGLPQWSVRQ